MEVKGIGVMPFTFLSVGNEISKDIIVFFINIRGNKYMIFYFTGTGNSEYIAKRLSFLTGQHLFCINDKIKDHDYGTILSKDGLIIVVPTYAWQIPKVVQKWIKKTEFMGSRKTWFIMTCGEDIGNAGKYNEELCQHMNFTYMGTEKVVMPENYIAMFDVPNEKECESIIAQAEPVIKEMADKILSKEKFAAVSVKFSDRLKSGFVNEKFYQFFVKAKAFRTTRKCINCGKCVTLCPLNNIKLIEKKPVWGNDCTHCMACICNCPSEAIEYGKKSIGKRRYRCQ